MPIISSVIVFVSLPPLFDSIGGDIFTEVS